MTSSETRIEQRITELKNLLSECRRWHHGDPWRYTVDTKNKAAWQDQDDKLAAALNQKETE
jgi:hypothetical protein